MVNCGSSTTSKPASASASAPARPLRAEAARRRLFFDQQLRQAKEDLAQSEEAFKHTQQFALFIAV